jgi:hypothetical protein
MGPMKALLAIRNWCGGHKKLTATLVAAGVELAGKYLHLDAAQCDKVAATIVAYVLGQGLADVGKEKAKVECARGVVAADDRPGPVPTVALK